MDPVPLAIAAAPLAIYLLVLGIMNLSRHPHVATGARETIGLAFAVSGLLIVGPINLLLPQGAVVRLGIYVWPLLIVFYGLCVLLAVLVSRPRLVIYNISVEQLRPVLEETLRRLDSEARFAGEAVQLPQLSVQFHLDTSVPMRNVSLVSTGDRQSYGGWLRLGKELQAALSSVEVTSNPRGFTFLALAALMLGWPIIQLVQLPQNAVAQRLLEILRL
jgi:hypothetical protein